MSQEYYNSLMSSQRDSVTSDWAAGVNASLQGIPKMQKLMEDSSLREDEHTIEFSDTRSFAADKWNTAVDSQEITAADWDKGRDVQSVEQFTGYIRRSMDDNKPSQQRGHFQSLLLLARPFYTFTNAFQELVRPEKVDMSVIWRLMYLDIDNAVSQPVKFKYLTRWLGTLKRSIDALNQCVENSTDKNSTRTQITDVFQPLLDILTGLLRYQRMLSTEGAFTRELPQIRDFVKQTMEEVDNVVYHFRQIALHTREQQDLNERRSTLRSMPIRSAQHQNPYDRAAFPVDNLPDIRTDKFFGRDQIIDRTDKVLGNVDNEQLRSYLLYGLRGVGKTQIALEYARRYRSKFDAVFWVRCETSASLRQSFSDIAVALELSTPDQVTRFEENQIKVLEWLKKTSKSWLLIYDNAEREQALNAYWPRDATGSVLLTSRSYYNFEHNERREGETIPVFNEAERWELLLQLLGEDWQHRHLGGKNGVREREAADKLCRSLGGLALAISQAAALVLDAGISRDQSIVSILDLFEKTSKTLPPRLFGHRTEKIHALDTVMAIALNHVSSNARSLLSTFSLLAPDSIPIDLFLVADQSRLDGRLEFCKQNDEYNRGNNHDRRVETRTGNQGSNSSEDTYVHVDDTSNDGSQVETKGHVPSTHDTTKNADDEGPVPVEMSPRMTEAVEELIKARLIRQDGRTFVIHRVTQEAMNFKDMDDLQSSFNATIEMLYEAFPIQLLGRPLISDWPRCQMFVQHVVHITKTFALHQRGKHGYLAATITFIKLLSNCGWYLYEVADYTECVDMTNIACSAYDDKRSLLYSHLVNILGGAYFERNQMKKARNYFAEARELREIHLSADHPQVATALSNLGNVETSDGNLDEAQELFEQAARIKERHGEKEIVSLGMSFLQLGRVAALRDQTFVAVNRYDKAEACWIRNPAQSRQFRAFLHFARGNLELRRPDIIQAMSQYEKCRDLCHANFPVHPLAAATFYKIALCDTARGRRHYDRALANLEKAYNIATVRSGNEIDGVVARIQWKMAELMIDNPIRRVDGLRVRDDLKMALQNIATELDLQIQPEWTEDETFDMLVPGYFR